MYRPLSLLFGIILELSAAEHFVQAGFTGISSGRSDAPWKSIEDAFDSKKGNPAPGDIISVRPGIYKPGLKKTYKEFWIEIPNITLRRDPRYASNERVIIDGDVSLSQITNRTDPADIKTQKKLDNGTFYHKVLGVKSSAHGVTIEGLEVRNGYSGIFTEARNTIIRNCHVHHTSQNGIKSTGPSTEIADCIVHDVVLYNLDGQCLDLTAENVDTRKLLYDYAGNPIIDKGNGKQKHMDWGQGISVSGDYPKTGETAYNKVTDSGYVHGNLLWNAWSEGIGTYISTRSRLIANTAFNIWRVGFYVQNADRATLSDNLAFFSQAKYDKYATIGCFMFANEQNGFIPDTSYFSFLNNYSVAGGYPLKVSTFNNFPMNTQNLGPVSIKGNLLTLPPDSQPRIIPCIEVRNTVLGSVGVTSNVLVQSRGKAESDFISASPGISSNNTLRLRPDSFTTTDSAMAEVVAAATRISTLPETAPTTDEHFIALRQTVVNLRNNLSRLKDQLRPSDATFVRGTTALAYGGIDMVTGTIAGRAEKLTYTCTNRGKANLTTSKAAVTAVSNCSTLMITAPGATIRAGESSKLEVSITPTAAGVWSATVTMTTNDTNDNSYTWTISGTAAAQPEPVPEVDVARGTTPVVNGGTDTVTGMVAGTVQQLTYTFKNSGVADLTTSNPAVTAGTNCTATLTTAPGKLISANASSNLIVSITPKDAGLWRATVSVTTDDTNENPYNWTISGTAAAQPEPVPVPEVDVARGTTPVVDGGTDTVNDMVAGTVQQITYTFKNSGVADLTTSNPAVTAKTNCTATLTIAPGKLIRANASSNLIVSITPSDAGVWSATVNVDTNDAHENPYNWTISGTATAAAPVAPAVTNQPQNSSVTVGQTATFTVVATGVPAPAFQWYKNKTAISGATSASYTTPITEISDNGAQFSVSATNSVKSVDSNSATLTVTAIPDRLTPNSSESAKGGGCGIGGLAGFVLASLGLGIFRGRQVRNQDP